MDKSFEPPNFSGEFKVGTTLYHWIDEERQESFTPESGGSTAHAVDHPEGDLGAYHHIWAKDQLFVAKKVRDLSMKPAKLLSKKVSNYTAIVGHSYGGASGFHAATINQDIDAIVDIDGRIFDLEDKSISTPFMYIHSEELSQEEAFGHVNARGYAVIFKGLTHNSFTDLPIYWNWDFPQEHIFGDMKQNNPQVVVAEYIVDFLNSEFFQQKTHLLKTSKIEIIEYPCKSLDEQISKAHAG